MREGRLIQVIFYNNPDNYPPIVNSVRLLARAGFRVEILCRDDDRRWGVSYPAGARVIRIDTRGRNSWQEYLGFVARVLRSGSKQVSLFVGHDMHGFLPARLLAALYRRPLIYHCHDFAEVSKGSAPAGGRLVSSFERRFAQTAGLVIIPDAERAAVVGRELHLKQDPLVVANAPLKRQTTIGEALHEALALRERRYEKVVFRQGRIGAGHAIESTLRSIPYWSNPKWGFVVMGCGEPSYLERLSAQATSLGVGRQFVILPPVGYDHVTRFTPGADLGHALYEPVHINNIHITTASNKIMEYMEAGLPLLVSERPSLKSLVKKYNCGLTADEQSPESIAAAVNILLGDPQVAKKMGVAARQAFEQEFCYERQFDPVINAFHKLSETSLNIRRS